jgi:hypothetical protein
MVDLGKKTIDAVTLALYGDLLPACTSIRQSKLHALAFDRGSGFAVPPHSVIAAGLWYLMLFLGWNVPP